MQKNEVKKTGEGKFREKEPRQEYAETNCLEVLLRQINCNELLEHTDE